MAKRDIEKDLREIVGDRFTTSLFERRCYTNEFIPIPQMVKAFFQTLPDAVIKPLLSKEITRVLEYCAENGIPVTPRGGGTSGLFGAVPKRGGFVLDLRGLTKVLEVDPTTQTVTTEPGISWSRLDRVLRESGHAVKSYPSSALSATVGGWIMCSGLGIGSLKHGDVFSQLVSADVVLPNGKVNEYSRGRGLELFHASEGMFGIIARLSLEVRKIPARGAYRLIYFSEVRQVFDFGRELSATAPLPYAVELFDHGYLSLVKASGYPTTQFSRGGAAALVAYEGSNEEVLEGEALVAKLTSAYGGEARPEAQDEWNHRFNMLRVRRAAPTVVPCGLHVPADNLDGFYVEMGKMNKRPLGFIGHIVSSHDCVVMPMMVTDQRDSKEFTLALHTVRDLARLALSMGGIPGGGVGLWNQPYKKRIFSAQRIEEMRRAKKDLDPKGILNPGMWLDSSPLLNPLVYESAMAVAAFADKVLSPRIGTENRKALSYEVSAYVQCGYCMDWCPTRGNWISGTPRGRILTTRDVLKGEALDGSRITREYADSIFQCTLCGRCKIDCSVSIRSPEIWVDLRRMLAARAMEPDNLKAMAKTVAESRNLTGKPNEQRTAWARRVRTKVSIERRIGAKVIYFVGCVTSFYPMVQDIARSFTQLLDLAGVDFTVLGGEEWCCGYPLVSAGHLDEAIDSLRHNRDAIEALGAQTVVVTCPGCHRMWKHEYGRTTGQELPFEVLHSSQLIWRLVQDGSIKLDGAPERITYHDPCDLGRVAGLFDEPRDIIKSIPGAVFTELRDSRERCSCCGSGGDLLASNTDMSLAIAAAKLEEAVATGAKSLITACPSCVRTLLMARMSKKSPIEVLDLAQLVWKAAAKK